MAWLRQLLAAIPARTGVYLEELDTGATVTHLEDEDFPAASIIKVPILLEALRQGIDLSRRVPLHSELKVGGAGVLQELDPGLTPTVGDLCRLMIVVSDNVASNMLVDMVGQERVNQFMAHLGMAGSHLGRRFMETPSPGRDNRMTPADAGRCLAALWRGEALPQPGRDLALGILRRQQYRERLPLMLPEEVLVCHKTGELAGVRHDAGIVELKDRPYVLVVFTDQGGHPWEVDLPVAALSRAVYERMSRGGEL